MELLEAVRFIFNVNWCVNAVNHYFRIIYLLGNPKIIQSVLYIVDSEEHLLLEVVENVAWRGVGIIAGHQHKKPEHIVIFFDGKDIERLIKDGVVGD